MSINNNSRKVYTTDSGNSNIFHDAISEVTEENADYNIDASASALLVNMTNQSPNTCMPRENFSSLSPEVKQIWSKTPNDMKAIILLSKNGSGNEGVANHNKNSCKSVKPSSFPPRKFTKAHLHELLSELISENSLSDNNETTIAEGDQDPESTMLVNATSTNTINPGDLCKLIFEPNKNKGVVVKK